VLSKIEQNNLFFIKYFLRYGATVFGGPVALTERLQSDFVEKYKIVSQESFNESLTVAQFCPGPLISQIIIHLMTQLKGFRFAYLCAILFLTPGFFICVFLGLIYKNFSASAVIQNISLTVSPVVIAILVISSFKMLNTSANKKILFYFLAVLNIIVVCVFNKTSIGLILASGFIYLILNKKILKKKLMSFFPEVISLMSLVFLKAGLLIFGGGLAIIPYLQEGLVQQYKLLNYQQFLDSVAVSMLTPGPAIICVSFMGYLIYDFSGALVATFFTFVPSWLLLSAISKSYSQATKYENMKIVIEGITAAVIGALIGSVYILAKDVIKSPFQILLMFLAFGLLLFFKKKEIYILLGFVFLGVVSLF